ncbi:hypothetical protein DFH08DRAFT_1049751 [Mycena albidolilacea]|uniref:Transmembrane protein n=1 Tax=Mycena albidolilacea TaxID=1033008 RepID=A0AAD6Z651_9AGAR|nr:hypothetical protein DFH08DRAFT_1049751 [Mycena albidolilacea]
MSSGPLTGEDLRLAGAWLGPWLVGGCLDIFLLGILLTQFRNYFTWYHDDKMSLRVIVAILLVGHILKTAHAFAIIWIQNIAYFGNLQGAILLNYTTWWQSGTPLIDGIFGFYVQIYFCYRLWMISKKLFVVVPVAIIFLFAFLSIVVATYFIATTNLPQISNWFAAHLGSVFAGDVCMTSLTAYFLIKSKADVLPQMVGPNSNEITGGRSRGTRRQDIELGQIQVVTQTRTHVDVFESQHDNRDMKAYSATKSDGDELEQYK